MKIKMLCFLIVSAFLLNCGTIHYGEPKVYVDGMEPLMKKHTNDVLAKIEDEWEFECSKFWTKKNPTFKDISKEIKGKTAFTEEEASEIFSPKGEYKVMIFYKVLRTDKISMDTITSMGTSMGQSGGKIEDKSQAYIRVVLRDDFLVHFLVWSD